MTHYKLYLKPLGALLFVLMATLNANAQFTRSTFSMEGVGYRMQLNPALTPDQGYFNIPIIGGIEAAANSNSLGSQDIINVFKNKSGDDFYMKDSFYNKLKAENNLQANVTLDLLSFGWYKGKNFWSVNVTVKNDVGATIPQGVFDMLRASRGLNTTPWSNFIAHQGGEQVYLNSYVETGLGFARPINDKLTVGGKIKVLFGAANAKLDIKKLDLQTQLTGIAPDTDWKNIQNADLDNIKGTANISVEATAEASMKGFELLKDGDGFINDVEQGGSFGVAGMGAGIDLGATYKPMDGLTLSAAVLDLGFISWNKDASHSASSISNTTYNFDGNHPNEAQKFKDIITEGKVMDLEVLNIKEEAGKARTTSLYSSIVLGGEYQLPNTNLTFGLLSTTRFSKPTTQTELTLSSAYKVNRHIGFSLAYSMIQSGGKGLGLGIKLGPVILATDYMYFGNNTKSLNALFGISVPLGARKQKGA